MRAGHRCHHGARIVRGVAILGLLLVRSSGTVWIAYVVTGIAVSASAFFEPARSATVPAIVPREQQREGSPFDVRGRVNLAKVRWPPRSR